MGRDSLEEMLLLSKTKFLICSRSNLSELAIMTSKNKISYLEIDNGFNTNRIVYSQFVWFVKQKLPKFLGGFENNLKLNFTKKFFKC